jgi:small redox-active disulfide protein 2
MEIRILGPGCPRCHEVEKRTIDVLAKMDVAADVQRISDMKKIAEYKIMATPGLVINNKLRSTGRIPSKDEIRKWIEEESEQ